MYSWQGQKKGRQVKGYCNFVSMVKIEVSILYLKSEQCIFLTFSHRYAADKILLIDS